MTNGSVTKQSARTIAVRVNAMSIPTGEGQVDDRVDERLAVEVVPDEHPRGDRSEHGVDHGDDEGGPERELQRRDCIRLRDDLPERVRAVPPGLPDDRRERQDHDHGQVRGDHADGQGRAGPSVGGDPAGRG
jgi:hypothetical protein